MAVNNNPSFKSEITSIVLALFFAALLSRASLFLSYDSAASTLAVSGFLFIIGFCASHRILMRKFFVPQIKVPFKRLMIVNSMVLAGFYLLLATVFSPISIMAISGFMGGFFALMVWMIAR